MEHLQRRSGRRPARRALRRVPRGCRAPDNGTVRHGPGVAAPGRPRCRSVRRASVALVAIAAGVLGNALLLVEAGFELALLGRAIVGIGAGGGFVAGLDLVRAGGGGPALQGLYGGATMAGGGLALMVVPPLTAATSWRAAYWSAAALALLAAVPTLTARALPRVGQAGAWVLRDRLLLPIGAPPGRDVRTCRRRRELGGPAARAPGSKLDRRRCRRRADPLRRHRNAAGGRSARRAGRPHAAWSRRHSSASLPVHSCSLSTGRSHCRYWALSSSESWQDFRSP